MENAEQEATKQIELTDVMGESISFKSKQEALYFLEQQIEYWESVSRKLISEASEHVDKNITIIKNSLPDNFKRLEHPQAIALPFDFNQDANFFWAIINTSFITVLKTGNNQSEHYLGLNFATQASRFIKENKINLANINNNPSAIIPATLAWVHMAKKSPFSRESTETEIEITKDRFGKLHKKFDEALASFNSQSTKSLKQQEKELENLRQLYEEKLKLESPTNHWQEVAENFGDKGRKWIKALIVISILLIGGFGWLFYSWLDVPSDTKNFVSLDRVQGIVLLTAIVAFGGALIRALSRLAFSAFHLQRNAEEKRNLAYFYLSLSRDETMDNESKRIVFQSLFRNSETGLIQTDKHSSFPAQEIIQNSFKK